MKENSPGPNYIQGDNL